MKLERKNNYQLQMQFTIDLMPDRTGVRICGSRIAFHDLHRGIWDCIVEHEFEGGKCPCGWGWLLRADKNIP